MEKKIERLVDCIINGNPIRYDGGLYYPYALFNDFFLVSESLVPDGFDVAFDGDYQFVEDGEFLNLNLFKQFDKQIGKYDFEGMVEEGCWSIKFEDGDAENYYLYDSEKDYNRDFNLIISLT